MREGRGDPQEGKRREGRMREGRGEPQEGKRREGG